MTGVGDVAGRSEPDARTPLSPLVSEPLPRPVRLSLAPPTARAHAAPDRATASPPSVLRI